MKSYDEIRKIADDLAGELKYKLDNKNKEYEKRDQYKSIKSSEEKVASKLKEHTNAKDIIKDTLEGEYGKPGKSETWEKVIKHIVKEKKYEDLLKKKKEENGKKE